MLARHVLSVSRASNYRILKIIRKLGSSIPISKRKKFKFREVNSLALSHRVSTRARVGFPPLSTPSRLRGESHHNKDTKSYHLKQREIHIVVQSEFKRTKRANPEREIQRTSMEEMAIRRGFQSAEMTP